MERNQPGRLFHGMGDGHGVMRPFITALLGAALSAFYPVGPALRTNGLGVEQTPMAKNPVMDSSDIDPVTAT